MFIRFIAGQVPTLNWTTLYQIEKGNPSVALGSYFFVLRVLNFEGDFLKPAEDDEFGGKLQGMGLIGKSKFKQKGES